MYVNQGSNALKLEPIVQRAQTVKQKKKYKMKHKHKVKYLVAILIVFGVAMMMCARYVQIYGQNALIQQKANELQNMEAANTQLELNIEKAVDTKTVEEYAQNVLGMKKPDRYQIAYITASGEDVMSKSDVKESNKNSMNVFGVITSTFQGVLEYFH